MNNFIIISLTAAAMTVPAIFAGVGAVKVVEPIVAPMPVNMALKRLDYKDGLFKQEHYVVGTEKLPAKWTAQILRGELPLCQGSGDGVYESGRQRRMDANTWVGDKCPPLTRGDRAVATWQFTTEDGLTRVISGERIIE